MTNDFIHLPLHSDDAVASEQECIDVLRAYAAYPSPAIRRLSGQGLRTSAASSGLYPGQWSAAEELLGLGFGGCENQGADTNGGRQPGPLSYMTSTPVVQDSAQSGSVSYPISPQLPMSSAEVNGDAWSTSPSSAASSLAISPFTNVFQNNPPGAASHQIPTKPLYTTAASLPPSYAIADLRSRVPAPTSVMPPPSSSPRTPNPIPPALTGSVRDYYATPTPNLARHTLPAPPPRDLLSSSPHLSFSTPGRGPGVGASSGPSMPMLSPAQGGNSFMGTTEAPRLEPPGPPTIVSVPAGPPLQPTMVLQQITSTDGQVVRPEIHARIDKGFFLFDQDWTCYRRNYFSVACSYTLKPSLTSAPLYLSRSDAIGGPARIAAFAMSISAVVDDAGGKAVDLIQHTPKRDKGPLLKPERIQLIPHHDGSLGLFAGAFSSGRIHHEYDRGGPHAGGDHHQTVAHFERIQFKSATANNGKRRAAQQYYHLVVDLFADVGSSLGFDGRWVKVAKRVSAPVVVRGRSPGHYQDDRRGSSSSMGPRGPGVGDYGGPVNHFAGPASVGRGLGDSSFFGTPGSTLGGGGSGGSYQLSGPPPIWGESPLTFDGPLVSRRRSSTCLSGPDVDMGMGKPSPKDLAYPQTYPSPPPEAAGLNLRRPSYVLPPCSLSSPSNAFHADEGHVTWNGISRDDSDPDGSSVGIPWHLGSGVVRDRIKYDLLLGEGRRDFRETEISEGAHLNFFRV